MHRSNRRQRASSRRVRFEFRARPAVHVQFADQPSPRGPTGGIGQIRSAVVVDIEPEVDVGLGQGGQR
jgi:hypothetical protein